MIGTKVTFLSKYSFLVVSFHPTVSLISVLATSLFIYSFNQCSVPCASIHSHTFTF